MTRIGTAGLVATVASLVFASNAKAESAALHVSYVVPDGCPSREAFEALVLARTPIARFADAPIARSLRVEIDESGAAFHGHLSMDSGRSLDAPTRRERSVDGETCADVVDALGLVTALAIDPDASMDPNPVRSPPVAAPPVPQQTPPPAVSLPQPTTSVALPSVTSSPPPRPFPPRIEGRVPESASVRWRGNVGGVAALYVALSPDPLLGGGVDVELESTDTRPIAPSLRLSAFAAANTFVGTRQASFTHFAVRLDGCPFRLGVPAWSVRACVAADVGFVRAVGVQIAHPQVATNAWFDLGVLARGRWSPGGGRFFIEADLAALFPITQPHYFFDTRPNPTPVYQVPPVAMSTTLGLGLRFW